MADGSFPTRERPILFSCPMVRAILAGKKTQTRRVISPVQPRQDGLWPAGRDPRPDCPYGRAGQLLWVREAFASERQEQAGTGAVRWMHPSGDRCGALYRADGEVDGQRWRPSIHLPRCLARIVLEVTGIRVERLQDISEADARAEGVDPAPFCKAERPPGLEHVEAFEELWDRINGKRPGCSWNENPFVWVVEFKRVKP